MAFATFDLLAAIITMLTAHLRRLDRLTNSNHTGIVNVVLADGAVRSISRAYPLLLWTVIWDFGNAP